MFGKFSLIPVPDLSCVVRLEPKRQELLAALLINSGHFVRRGQLACQLWPQQSEVQARQLLSKALKKLEKTLQRELQNQGEASPPIFTFTGDQVGISFQPQIWVDAVVFQRAVRQAGESSKPETSARRKSLLIEATELYSGPFLEGCYSPWRLQAAQQFEEAYFWAAERLMDLYEAEANYEQALSLGQRTLRLDHSRENINVRLIRLLYLSGDRSAAIRQYQHCVEVLRTDLQVQPSMETKKVYQQIQAGYPLQG